MDRCSMHFVGIKCEVCNALTNCKDSIDDLPKGWIALVQRAHSLYFRSNSKEALHFCCMKCLCAWVGEQEQAAPANEAGIA
jgi:hypothetical protein